MPRAPGWDRGLETAVVLGAGGTARAVVYGLSERGVTRIHVVNRTLDRAMALREEFGERVNPLRWEELNGLLSGAGLLVNTTSLGMTGKPPLSVNLARLPASAVVADVVYAPLETALLAAARGRGLRTVDGLGMLLHQAVSGFELWFGVRPKVTPELRALVEADLRPWVRLKASHRRSVTRGICSVARGLPLASSRRHLVAALSCRNRRATVSNKQ